MEPQIQLYEDPAERRRVRREEEKKWYAAFNQAFGERLTKVTANFQAKTGRTFTHSELAAMLRERAGKPITPRYVGRWYRGLAFPRRTECMTELAKIFDVSPGWLTYGEGAKERQRHGVYETPAGWYILDSSGKQIASVTDAGHAEDVLSKCYELLHILSPDQPSLRVVK